MSTVTQCNVRGLQSKLDQLQHMMNELSPSVVCVSEPILNYGVIDSEINIPGYTLLRLDRNNPRSSTFGEVGVSMYLKDNIPFFGTFDS